MKNMELAQSVLDCLRTYGVREIVLCAGARNAPFVALLSSNSSLSSNFGINSSSGFKVYSFFEERSASFFAIGRMQSEGVPVAVITTSGTAAAELLPAAVEADYQRLPLVMITADRPSRYRGSGAPQAIVQTGIYSHYVEQSYDLEKEALIEIKVSGKRPIHLNVCFDEPLLDGGR